MKRYTKDATGMFADPSGEWVRYEDHCEAMKRAALSAGEAQPMQLPESMSRDEMLSYYSQYANVQANEALQYQKRIRDLEALLAAQPPASAEAERDAERLGEPFESILHDNLPSLYITDEPSATPAPVASPAADQSADRQWRAGFLAGWNAGIEGDEAKLRAAQNRVGKLADYEVSASPAALTPMLLANAAFCIEHWNEVPEAKRKSIMDKLLAASEALAAQPPAAAEAEKRYRHKKSGGIYQVLVPLAYNEADQAKLVVYRSEETGFVWVRPHGEFQDKFERAGTTPKGEKA